MKLQLMKQQAEQDSRKNGLPSSQSSSSNFMAHESSFAHATLASQINQNQQLINQNLMTQQDNETGGCQQQNLVDELISTSAEIIPRSLLSQAYQVSRFLLVCLLLSVGRNKWFHQIRDRLKQSLITRPNTTSCNWQRVPKVLWTILAAMVWRTVSPLLRTVKPQSRKTTRGLHPSRHRHDPRPASSRQ